MSVLNKKKLYGLEKYMHAADKSTFKEMLEDDKYSFRECDQFAQNAIHERQISGGHSYTQSEDMEYKEYEDKLSPEELLWVKRFYNEMYANRHYVPKDYRLLTTEEQIKESNRINNMRNRDLYQVKKERRQLDSIDRPMEERDDSYTEDNMLVILDEFGYEEAVKYCIDSTMEELENDALDTELTLVRFYIKMNMLKKEVGYTNFFGLLKDYENEQEN